MSSPISTHSSRAEAEIVRGLAARPPRAKTEPLTLFRGFHNPRSDQPTRAQLEFRTRHSQKPALTVQYRNHTCYLVSLFLHPPRNATEELSNFLELELPTSGHKIHVESEHGTLSCLDTGYRR
jgi:hypothetical protein